MQYQHYNNQHDCYLFIITIIITSNDIDIVIMTIVAIIVSIKLINISWDIIIIDTGTILEWIIVC